MRKVEGIIKPSLDKAFQEYLGCQNFIFSPCGVFHFPTAPNDDVAKFTDIRMGLFLDTDAANFKGSVIGFCLTLIGIEEIESFDPLWEILENLDRQGWLRKEGRAVCLVSCEGVDGIWVYGEKVKGAELVREKEGVCLSRIFSVKKDDRHFLGCRNAQLQGSILSIR